MFVSRNLCQPRLFFNANLHAATRVIEHDDQGPTPRRTHGRSRKRVKPPPSVLDDHNFITEIWSPSKMPFETNASDDLSGTMRSDVGTSSMRKRMKQPATERFPIPPKPSTTSSQRSFAIPQAGLENVFTYEMSMRGQRMDDNDNSNATSSTRFEDVPKSVLKRREATLRRIRTAIQKRFGKEYDIQAFGSTRYGVSSADSDLDLAILDPARPSGLTPGCRKTLPAIYTVRLLARVLSRAGFTNVMAKPWPTVPIVTFRDPVTSLNCDINVNERLGIYNSELIKHYCAIFPPLRPLLSSIKAWAKRNDLNNPAGRVGYPPSFSSYSLALMTIGFLQHRGYIPNLQSNLPDAYRLEFWVARPGVTCCDCRFHTKPPQGWRAPDLPKQDDLLRSWFRYWATEFRYDELAVNIRKGSGIAERDDLRSPSLMRDAPRTGPPPPFCVVDPFITTKNCVKNVAPKMLERFKEQCGRAG